jgi:hypothetical protein
VVETAPAVIPGYTWGTITYTPETIVISDKNGTFEIVVGNSITRDRGNFKITKSTSNPDGATLPAAFTGTYDCGVGYTGVFSVANGASQTITGIPTGNTCSVVETAPAVIPGYTWGTITYTPETIVISDKNGTFEIVVGNSITHDRGNFKITKSTSNPDGATLPAAFTGTDCTLAGSPNLPFDRIIAYSDPGFVTITDIPSLYSCAVTEPTKPVAPVGYSWGTTTITGPVTITKGGTAEVTVNNPLIPSRGMLLPTQTTCDMYRLGTWLTPYTAFTYGLKAGKINSISPGVIFYYNTVTVLATGEITIVQSNTQSWPTMLVHSSISQAKLYNMNCDLLIEFPASYGGSDNVVMFNNVTAGTYIIGIKYSPGNLVGYSVDPLLPNESEYAWDTDGYPGSLAKIWVKPR